MAEPPLSRISAPRLSYALLRRLFQPVDVASLVAFRIAFGALMAWESWNYLSNDAVRKIYVLPPFHFTWPGFGWVHPWPGDGMYLHFYGLVLLGLLIAAGLFYRASAALFCLGFTYVFLLDQGYYQNHFYLICLLGFLLVLAPANASLSLDAWLWPRLRRETVPAWSLWLLRLQIGVVYFFGGVAKLNGDWLRGYPLRLWLPLDAKLPGIGWLYKQAWVAIAMSWSGLAIDLLAVPALSWRRSRPFAFVALAAFHLWNSQLFEIGVFPWLAIAATTLFFDPDWPRRVFQWPRREPRTAAAPTGWNARRRAVAVLFTAWAAVQLLLPLRHLLYPGWVHWTEEGHNFAWRMKVRDKVGVARFFLRNPETSERWKVDPTGELAGFQLGAMIASPDMLQQYAQHLSDLASAPGGPRVEVRVAALVSLDSREPQPLVEPTLDLAAAPVHVFGHDPWIAPLVGEPGRDWAKPNEPAGPAALEPADQQMP